MITWITQLPLWQIIRVLGLISFVLLTAGIGLGISYGFPFWNGQVKAKLYKIHTLSTNTGMALGLLHGMITVIDTYTPFSWSGVFIPFTAARSPVLNGLGTLSVYGMLLVIFTSDIRNKIKKKLWFLIHLLSYPIFVMTFIHGYFLGTDTQYTGIRWLYLVSALVVVGLSLVRFMITSGGPARTAGKPVSR
ncbi:ferric reductase [Paenibacillus rigui]|uniref:Ferric reductase n=1 Tax=Paenibacillus rigui TaxID=554312 RepID=A0A229USK6_9BACL|nr:ferric reductase [Paenibacillus rigui]OXM86340.1 ferric reductase [Paenibacillus rigui]